MPNLETGTKRVEIRTAFNEPVGRPKEYGTALSGVLAETGWGGAIPVLRVGSYPAVRSEVVGAVMQYTAGPIEIIPGIGPSRPVTSLQEVFAPDDSSTRGQDQIHSIGTSLAAFQGGLERGRDVRYWGSDSAFRRQVEGEYERPDFAVGIVSTNPDSAKAHALGQQFADLDIDPHLPREGKSLADKVEEVAYRLSDKRESLLVVEVDQDRTDFDDAIPVLADAMKECNTTTVLVTKPTDEQKLSYEIGTDLGELSTESRDKGFADRAAALYAAADSTPLAIVRNNIHVVHSSREFAAAMARLGSLHAPQRQY